MLTRRNGTGNVESPKFCSPHVDVGSLPPNTEAVRSSVDHSEEMTTSKRKESLFVVHWTTCLYDVSCASPRFDPSNQHMTFVVGLLTQWNRSTFFGRFLSAYHCSVPSFIPLRPRIYFCNNVGRSWRNIPQVHLKSTFLRPEVQDLTQMFWH